MVKRALALALLFVATLAGPAYGQDYLFWVEQNRSDVFIRDGGGVDLEYALTFLCDPSSHPIDIVDVGLPNRHYQLKSVEAWLDGQPVTKVRRSEFLPVGVEIHLGDRTIAPGKRGTLQVRVHNPHLVFEDTDDPTYASVEFYPTYYGDKFTIGRTKLQVAIHFPAGADGEHVKWHYRQYDQYGADEQGRLVFVWKDDQASPSSPYKFGVSFPRSLVNEVYAPLTTADYTSRGCSGGVGESVGLLIGLGLVVAVFTALLWRGRRRRMRYFPPVASVEGGDIKRGLTAPEAAVLLEFPLDKVLPLIILGLVKKEAIRIEPGQEVKFKVIDPKFKGRRIYETFMLRAILPAGKLKEKVVREMFIEMIRSVQRRMQGHNVKKTREHYRDIVSKAWKQVKDAGAPQDLSKIFDDQVEWLMVDPKAGARMKDAVESREILAPVWWAYYHPDASTAAPAAGTPPGTPVWVKGVDFADAWAGRIEALADHAVSHITEITTGVTQQTNPPPVVRSYSSGESSSGGSSSSGCVSCACACACAGCACACAGGGR